MSPVALLFDDFAKSCLAWAVLSPRIVGEPFLLFLYSLAKLVSV